MRHSERHLHSDPPTPTELRALADDARAVIDAAIPADESGRPSGGIGVGGTATQLASVDLGLAEHDRDRVEGHAMTRATLEGLRDRLALPLAERRGVQGLDPARAVHDLAGVVILIEAVARSSSTASRCPSRTSSGEWRSTAPNNGHCPEQREAARGGAGGWGWPRQDGQGYVP